MATFNHITSKEKRTFYQMITPAIYDFCDFITVIMTATNFACHPVDFWGSMNP